MGMAKCDRSTVASLVLDHAGRGGGGEFRRWPLFSAAAFRRKLAEALICGVSRRRVGGDGGRFGSRWATTRRRVKPPAPPPPPPPKQAGSDRLWKLLKAEMSESGSEDGEEEAEAETRRKTEVFEQLQGVVKRLRASEGVESEREDQRREAAQEVRRLAKGDPEARETLAMLGAIPPLVGMLDSPDLDLQVESLYALLNLGIGNDGNKAAIVATGAVHKMVKLVDTRRSVPVPVSGAIAANFLGLSALDSNKPIIGSSGAIPFIVETFRDAHPSCSQARQDALRALFNLSLAAANLPRLVDTGLVSDLLAAVGNMEVTERALAVLSNVVCTRQGRRAVSRSPEAFQILVDVLNWSDAPGCQEQAACVLMVMAHKARDDDRAAMVGAGIMSSLLELALLGTPLAQKRASRTLECLSVDKGKQVPDVFGGGGPERSAAPAVSAPLRPAGATEAGRGAEGEEARMTEERRAVKRLVQQSLRCNMRRMVHRANLAQESEPCDQFEAVAVGSTTKSLPF